MKDRVPPVRYAVVGLGHIAQVAMLPAFSHARENSVLGALISSDETKRERLSRQYGVPAYDYPDFEMCLAKEEIEAVYLAVPNHLHCEYAVRAARAGVHVLCEKPMAVKSKECEQMIAAARRNDVRLMIGYRLHFEPANLEAIALVRSGQIGEPRLFTSTFSMEVRPGNVRLEHEMGGGPLYDIGIYCINAARYIFGSEPTEVFAVTVGGHDRRFREVEEGASVTLHSPDDRLASFSCSFGASNVSSYRVVGTKGDLLVEPAYEYQEALVHRLTRNGGVKRRRFARRDQFAPELLHLSECIRSKNSDPEPSGEEGLIDVLILEGISQSARTGRRVALDLPRRMQRPSVRLERSRPPVKKPRLVEVESASR